MQMTNITQNEFRTAWSPVDQFILTNWNTGRGKRTEQTKKDYFFMLFVVCKHGCQWDFLAKMFGINRSILQRLISRFMRSVLAVLVDISIYSCREYHTMPRLLEDKTGFKNYKLAEYASDVTFRKLIDQAEIMKKQKAILVESTKLYGYKTDISVLPN